MPVNEIRVTKSTKRKKVNNSNELTLLYARLMRFISHNSERSCKAKLNQKKHMANGPKFESIVSVVFIPRERASIFLSYNECIRRMNCGVTRKEECSEECADGKHKYLSNNQLDVLIDVI